MNPGDIPRGDFLLLECPYGRRPAWLIGRSPGALTWVEFDPRLAVLRKLKWLVDNPGVPFDAAAISYTKGEDGPARWRRAVHRALTKKGLTATADALAWCLDLESGAVTYRPRHGIAFHTKAARNADFVSPIATSEQAGVHRHHGIAEPTTEHRRRY